MANYTGCKDVACDVYVCPSNLHVGMIYDKFESSVMVTPQNCNFKARATENPNRRSPTLLWGGGCTPA